LTLPETLAKSTIQKLVHLPGEANSHTVGVGLAAMPSVSPFLGHGATTRMKYLISPVPQTDPVSPSSNCTLTALKAQQRRLKTLSQKESVDTCWRCGNGSAVAVAAVSFRGGAGSASGRAAAAKHRLGDDGSSRHCRFYTTRLLGRQTAKQIQQTTVDLKSRLRPYKRQFQCPPQFIQ